MNQSWFCGYLRSFSATTGYGFVHNEELQQRYSRDVYVHASLLPAGIVCGAKVSFTLGLNDRGQPQCRQVWEEDTTELDENAMFQLLPVPLELEVISSPSNSMQGAVSRLLSWNILAPSYCNGAYFKDVHPDALRWSRRACQIKALLFSLCPEIICLQEVELHRLHDLGLSNYEMVSVQRPGTNRGARLDGCAIAWLANRFRILRKHEVFFDQYLIEKQEEEGDRNLTGHVALLVELLPIPSSPFDGLPQPLLVATTHLACGEELEEQRLTQAKILLQAIEEFGHQSQVVLCGDLNCLPGSQTYQFLSERLHSAYEDLEDPSCDLCTATNANVREALGFAEIIDYCFLWDRGAALNRWRPPSKTLLRQQLGDEHRLDTAPVPTLMRGGHWPSDHFPVVVDIALTAQCLQ